MIAIAKKASSRKKFPAHHHRRFLEFLPAIKRQARIAFRHCNAELRQELVCEVVANAFVAFTRLVELGKEELAYPTPLAQHAIKQVRVGRRVGGSLNVRDVLSSYAQQRKNFNVERLDRYDEGDLQWKEILVEDCRSGPAEIAASRIDFGDWMARLPRKQRRIANVLAAGETTSAAARRFRVTLGRVSQLRRELEASWRAFTGESPTVSG